MYFKLYLFSVRLRFYAKTVPLAGILSKVLTEDLEKCPVVSNLNNTLLKTGS